EWIRERDYWDAVATENTIRNAAIREGREEGLAKGMEEGLKEGLKEGRIKGIEEGIKQGIEQGIEQGKKEAILESARNLKLNGISTEIISKSLGLSLEEIEKL
ncbi:MAG: hypothetical protein K5829_14545, partial [Treponema sp.]|nr:hypothetical protein [Treponema sp.]